MRQACLPKAPTRWQVDLGALSAREQRMAFFINVYNVLVGATFKQFI